MLWPSDSTSYPIFSLETYFWGSKFCSSRLDFFCTNRLSAHFSSTSGVTSAFLGASAGRESLSCWIGSWSSISRRLGSLLPGTQLERMVSLSSFLSPFYLFEPILICQFFFYFSRKILTIDFVALDIMILMLVFMFLGLHNLHELAIFIQRECLIIDD